VATTRPATSHLARGIEARCVALLAADAAEGLYHEAVEELQRSQNRTELARAHLLYGEWLLGQDRRRDARDQLRTAEEMFTDIGMAAFARRAGIELLASGAKPRGRPADPARDLTPQEAQIARLARDGLTNAQIGAELFLSPRTVEWHLHKAFGKLRIESRDALGDVLPTEARPPEPVQD
jgi:DNA-binding NarL/FixJ family response regulator